MMENPFDQFDEKPAAKTRTPQAFAKVYGPAAERAGKALGVDPSMLLGQWGLETGWGKSVVPGTNNLGNIKDFAGGGVAATDNMTGSRDKYRKYDSPEAFADDFASLIQRKYPGAVGAKDPLAFATALKDGGYAEDPRYVDKVVQASRMAGTKPNPVMKAVGSAVEAVVPSAQAAEANPFDQFDEAPKATPAAKPEGKSMLKTATEAVTRALPGGTIINAIRGPGVDRDALKGFASGMADVGNTMIRGASKQVAPSDSPLTSTLPTQEQIDQQNADRQAGLQSYNTENASPAFTGGRIAGNVAATIPAGNALGAGVAAAGLPRLGAAIASGGMSTGAKVAPGFIPGAVDLGIRTAGGAASGGMAAGLVDPETAGQGAMIGAALPGVVKGLGAAGSAVGRTLRGPAVPPNVLAAASQGREAGYVIPPTQARPTLTNRLLEGFSGKITTAQNASARNQGVTNELAKKAINAPELTPEGLQAVRAQANQAYDELGKAGTFVTDDAFREALGKVGASNKQLRADFPEVVSKDIDGLVESFATKQGFDAQSAIEAMKRLRASASANKAAFSDPEKQALGRVQSKVSDALENLVERNLEKTGQADLLATFKSARQTLAKTYDIEKALNPASGNVDANKLASLLKKGRPLSDELKTIAEFSSSFPKATQTVEKMGSLPQTSPLDWGALGMTSAATGNPLFMAGVLARPAARSAVLSPMVQNRLGQQPNRLMQLSQDDLNLLAPLVRAAPLSGTSQSGR